MDGGYVNHMHYCRLADDCEESDVVLVRVNGEGSSDWVDRDKEVINMMVAHSVGMAAPLYCRSGSSIHIRW